MIVGGAVAGFAVRRAHAVSVLRDLDSGPVELAQSSDEASHDAGLAHAARMSANDDQSHKQRIAPGILAGCREGVRPRASGGGDARRTAAVEGGATINLSLPVVLTWLAVSNTGAAAGRAFPKMRRPSLSKSYSGE